VQFKRVALANQEEGATVGEFTGLVAAQFLTVQETGIRTKLLGGKIRYV